MFGVSFLMKNGLNNNMFTTKHYIPILKWKRAEQNALRTLREGDKKYMTPLIQFVMPKLSPKEVAGKTVDEKFSGIISKFQEKIPELPEELLQTWGTSPSFFDVSLLYTTELKNETINFLLSKGVEKGLSLIPVVYLSDESRIYKTITGYKHGVCLRLVCADLDDFKNLGKKIKDFFKSTGMSESTTDLLVDIKETGENTDKFVNYINLSKNIPNLKKWRTFTFASGAFHEDLSKCKFAEENYIPRLDWLSWANQTKDKIFPRNPSFSDYTIQYPIYREITQFFPPTTSIKYTIEDSWFILKGKKQKFEYYLANAKSLVGDDLFYGENFSSGDKFIFDKAAYYGEYMKDQSKKGTGSTEGWLTAGINHHLTLVVNQISKLP